MRWRAAILLACAVLLAPAAGSSQQPSRMPRIGVLVPGEPLSLLARADEVIE